MIKVSFCRYELKFLIDWKIYTDLRKRILPFVRPDNYGSPEGTYNILSLYYDSPNYDCYYDKIDGQGERYKLRLRWYLDNQSPSEYAHLELKKKHNGSILKERLKVKKDLVSEFLKGNTGSISHASMGKYDMNTAKKMLYYIEMQQLKPVVYTNYIREAYECTTEHRLRITFDMKISCQKYGEKEFGSCSKKYIFNPYYMVLEIKGFDCISLWLMNILNEYNLQQKAISKYCMALDKAVLIN